MNAYNELKDRGFIYQETDAAAIAELLDREKIAFYVGFDPTGSSLHVGHLLPIMAMRLLQKFGHKPIVLVGGATGQIGDPSGKLTARPILTKEEVAHNVECLRAQLARFIAVDQALFVNNADWFENVKYLDFLREIGNKFSVNKMLTQESVKMRLENGLSFLEFNYSILQAYDFYVLNRDYNCRMQFGGQDQWGNMVSGVDLVRRMSQNEVFCMTFPLLLDSSGKKFGKTAGGNNVWLDVNRTAVFDYYQFWRNCDDAQLEKLLSYFTALPMDEVRRLAALTDGGINRAKEILAYEATKLAHGEAAARDAYLAAGSKFGFADRDGRIPTSSTIAAIDLSQAAASDVPAVEFPADRFAGEGVRVTNLFAEAGLTKTVSEARRLVEGGGAYCNGERVADFNRMITAGDFQDGALLLKAGKKNMRKVVLR